MLMMRADNRQRFPKLIYTVVTGFGLEGPDKDKAAYDKFVRGSLQFSAQATAVASRLKQDAQPSSCRSLDAASRKPSWVSSISV